MHMLKNVTLGQYYPGNSPVHRLDPRMKIYLTIAYIVGVFMVGNLPGYVLALAFLLGATRLSGIRIKYLLRGLRPLMFIIVFTFVLNLFFAAGETVLVALGPLHITYEGLRTAVYYSLRLMFLVMGTSLLTLTTSPIQLTDGIERILRPLQVFHFPAHELAMMMTIALRFIPMLLEETDKIMKAQMARGADFESGNLMQKAKNMVPLLVPLFISAFRRANDLAMAMEARGYHGGEGRTKMKPLMYVRRDHMAYLMLLLYLIVMFIASRVNVIETLMMSVLHW